jgi:predicted hydrocarbon binding protein/predicted regulator of Ras-like GTPase activity (Roadblock/LC7/MglB family)
MEHVLRDIGAVAGVAGCFVCDAEGQILASTLPEVFEESVLASVSRTIAQTTAGLFVARRRKVNEIDLVFNEGRVVIKPLREGCLCVLCERNMNVPLLNLTADVAAKKLTEAMRRDASEPEIIQAEEPPVDLVLDAIVDAYPDLVRPVMDFEQSLTDGNRASALNALGRRSGEAIFQRRYSSMNVPASIPQALEMVAVPAVSPFVIANSQGNSLDVLACPFCRNLSAPSPHCHFLAGLVEGLLNSVPGMGDVEVAETRCRAQGDDTCSFLANPKPQ